jgi:hypothetical protein
MRKSAIQKWNKFCALLLALGFFAAILPSNLPAQTPSDATGIGITWLLSARYGTGIWAFDSQPDQLVGEFTADELRKTYIRDTLEAAKTLQAVNSIPVSEYKSTLDWLEFTRFNSAGQLAQKVQILSNAGKDVSQTTPSLLETRNSDGGFGGAKGYPLSNNLDTALALQALKAANYTDATVLYQAINFLTTNQNTDGGWGFISGKESNAYVTTIALRALAAFSSTFSIQSSIQTASAYLLTKQNTDGGFGSSPSNIYETALSIISLTPLESSSLTGQALQNAINYLTTTQSANGSWNDDPYSTALALQALANVKPNLAITTSDITFSKTMPQTGETITITAVIKNTGLEPASSISVRFYQGDPATGGVQIGSDQTIALIALGSSSTASVTTVFTGTGSKAIFVVADPDNLISEITKVDNKAAAQLWVATGADLAIFSSDLKPSTYTPASNTAFTLQYAVRNLGESATNGFDVAVYDGSPTGTPLQTGHISGIGGTETRTGTFGITLTGDGPHTLHTLYIVADSGNAIIETTKTNNTARWKRT